MLIVDNVTLRIGERVILDGANAAISDGRKVGLVGRNGAGKTTLLKLILGERDCETGHVEYSKSWRVGAVAQEAPSGPMSLIDTVLSADNERARLIAAVEDEHDPAKLGEIHARLAHEIDVVLDGGDCGVEPTTVVDLSVSPPVLVRVGKGALGPITGRAL